MTNKNSQRWLKEHFSDTYVKQAKISGYRSRAAYKLLEINSRDHLFKPGMIVVDLGAAPGGWSQVAAKLIKPKGKVFALDVLPMEPIESVHFIQGDFIEAKTVHLLQEELRNDRIDFVISDMAPNTSGNESTDIPRSIYLAELVLEFAFKNLRGDGGFLIKVFQGEGFNNLLNEIKRVFSKVMIRKPKASRSRSREVYILARELKTV